MVDDVFFFKRYVYIIFKKYIYILYIFLLNCILYKKIIFMIIYIVNIDFYKYI